MKYTYKFTFENLFNISQMLCIAFYADMFRKALPQVQTKRNLSLAYSSPYYSRQLKKIF